MDNHACIALAEQLNADCHCVSLDRERLVSELVRVSPGFDQQVMAPRPHLFSNVATFVGDAHSRRMAEIIAAIERVVALPAYQALVLAHAADIAHHQPGARGVFFGYDFHLGQSGPQLIEINTNAGGALLNALLERAQKACCDEVAALLPGRLADSTPEQMFFDMFLREWELGREALRRSASADFSLRTLAIVDSEPETQYLYPEFVLFKKLFAQAGIGVVICDPSALAYRDHALWHGELRIDLVYNRLTDFLFSEPSSAALRRAYLDDAAVITPHPRAYALYADKRNLVVLSSAELLASCGVDEATIRVLTAGIPRTENVSPELAADFWARRRQLFFKPVAGYGGKAAYRGDKITQRVFAEVLAGDYVAQALVPPSQRTLQVDEVAGEVAVKVGDTTNGSAGVAANAEPVALKVDLRNYVYAGQVQLVAARLWAGQTTNFRTPGGGFSPVLVVPCSQESA
jgi:hypothetical protein